MTKSSTDRVVFLTHAEVIMDPEVPVPEWGLSDLGRERHVRFASDPVLAKVCAVYSSEERKAREGAEIYAAALTVPHTAIHDLHENDRSATGYLPPDEFEEVADAFFATPEQSIRGWERAIDAQARVVRAVASIIAEGPPGDLLIVAHGGVGTLLRCHLENVAISRSYDQPAGGGNYITFDRKTLTPASGWIPI